MRERERDRQTERQRGRAKRKRPIVNFVQELTYRGREIIKRKMAMVC